VSTECSATFITVCVDPFTPSTNSQNAGPIAKIEGVTNSSLASDALLTCLEALTESFRTAKLSGRALYAKIGLSVLAILVPPSRTEVLILPETGPEQLGGAVQPGVIIGSSLGGVVLLGLLGAVAAYLYLWRKRKSETGLTLKHESSFGTVVAPEETTAINARTPEEIAGIRAERAAKRAPTEEPVDEKL
jgi:hypothetical protein